MAVVGLSAELEGEQKSVDEPGFKGGDRTSLDLPKPEQDLIEALAATRKPMVVVLTNGSALSVNWANAHANAILEAWYPGEEGGAAVAQTLSGRNNPSGRLPVTFYKGVDQLPAFENYSMAGRTYRYFTGTPLFPFGFGLSYTKFAYSSPKLSSTTIAAGESITAEVTITNIGNIEGDEVAQLYLSFPQVPGSPLRALRGFQRVHLLPGKTQVVHFSLDPRALSMVSEQGVIEIAAGPYKLSMGGGQPSSAVKSATADFVIKGTKQLIQ